MELVSWNLVKNHFFFPVMSKNMLVKLSVNWNFFTADEILPAELAAAQWKARGNLVDSGGALCPDTWGLLYFAFRLRHNLLCTIFFKIMSNQRMPSASVHLLVVYCFVLKKWGTVAFSCFHPFGGGQKLLLKSQRDWCLQRHLWSPSMG